MYYEIGYSCGIYQPNSTFEQRSDLHFVPFSKEDATYDSLISYFRWMALIFSDPASPYGLIETVLFKKGLGFYIPDIKNAIYKN